MHRRQLAHLARRSRQRAPAGRGTSGRIPALRCSHVDRIDRPRQPVTARPAQRAPARLVLRRRRPRPRRPRRRDRCRPWTAATSGRPRRPLAHARPLGRARPPDAVGLARSRLDVSGATSAAHAVSLVAARGTPPLPGTALVGFGFRDGLWPDVPTSALLDEAVGDLPVVLVSGDLHCAWASTAGLRFLGVHSHPTGLLRESEWLPISGAVNHVPDAVADALVHDACLAAAARAVSSASSTSRSRTTSRSGVVVPPRDPVRCASGRASGRTTSTGWCARTCTRATRSVSRLLEQGPLKVITDGSLNTRTAYCHDPYPGSVVARVPRGRARPAGPAHGARHPARSAFARSTRSVTPRTTWRSTRSRRPGAAGSIEHAQLLSAGAVDAVGRARRGRQRAARARDGRPRRRRPCTGRDAPTARSPSPTCTARASGSRSGPTRRSPRSTRGSPSTPR